MIVGFLPSNFTISNNSNNSTDNSNREKKYVKIQSNKHNKINYQNFIVEPFHQSDEKCGANGQAVYVHLQIIVDFLDKLIMVRRINDNGNGAVTTHSS